VSVISTAVKLKNAGNNRHCLPNAPWFLVVLLLFLKKLFKLVRRLYGYRYRR